MCKELQKVTYHKYDNDVISYTVIYVQAVILGLLQKITSHKYAKGVISYTMIYAQEAIFGPLRKKRGKRRAAILGPLRKKEEEEERPHWGHYQQKKKERKSGCPFKSPRGAPLPDSFATALQCTPTAASSKDAKTGGHLRLAKHSGERKFGESGLQSSLLSHK